MLLWNYGTTDGVKYDGAMDKTFAALQTVVSSDYLLSMYHVQFLLWKGNLSARCAAPYTDKATRDFVALGALGALSSTLTPKPGAWWSAFHNMSSVSAEERESLRQQAKEFYSKLGK